MSHPSLQLVSFPGPWWLRWAMQSMTAVVTSGRRRGKREGRREKINTGKRMNSASEP